MESVFYSIMRIMLFAVCLDGRLIRGYQLSDLQLLEALAVGASYDAALVPALPISSAPERLA